MIIKNLGIANYQSTLKAMQSFSTNRHENSSDELWLVQHPAVYTYGIKDSRQHLLQNPMQIPVVKTDRGGQITYHGLGQLIVYCLIDIKRARLSVRQFIFLLEQVVIDLLATYNIIAHRQDDMPGVYVNQNKISALGLKVQQGKTYHGLSLNIDMDLSPFRYINPCGYKKLQTTQIKDLTNPCPDFTIIADNLLKRLSKSIYSTPFSQVINDHRTRN